MAGMWVQPSLEFGVKVVRVTGLDPAHQRWQLGRGGALFVRYYVPAGDGTRRLRVRVDTREVPCGGARGEAFWGELARFECMGRGAAGAPSTPAAAAAMPGEGRIAFELRWRPAPSSSSRLAAVLLGRTGAKGRRPASRVLARAELAWQDTAKPAERWLTLSPAAGCELRDGNKAPKLLVEVDTVLRAAGAAGDRVARGRKARGAVEACCSAGECCGQCGWVGNEEDMFLAATFSQ